MGQRDFEEAPPPLLVASLSCRLIDLLPRRLVDLLTFFWDSFQKIV